MNPVNNFVNLRHAPLIAFIVLALAGGWALKATTDANDANIKEAQVAACERGNVLREETNDRVQDNQLQVEVLTKFLEAARTARLDAFAKSHNKFDLSAANNYTQLIANLKNVVYEKVPLADCDNLFKD